jgi:2-phospho-L-lactate transferase/gluconeogenesis factor (CofD/UPF0052 family)/glycosyltransferase involved in cell wall biosynthesis
VNAYDDGLSTGRMRAFIPGLLGPSDIRKGFSRLIRTNNSCSVALRNTLEYRLPDGTTFCDGKALLESLAAGCLPQAPTSLVDELSQLSVLRFNQLCEYARWFVQLVNQRASQDPPVLFDFSDCSFGNILFAGAFLKKDKSFNDAIKEFGNFCEIPGAVLNVTDGESLVLTALKEDGTYLRNEAEIVSKQSRVPIADIFLLKDYLRPEEEVELLRLTLRDKEAFLTTRSVCPSINPEVKELLLTADMIVYGPGTQHSSLLPSYLTAEVAEAVAANDRAEKVFIANIRKDNEIQSETANSLCEKLLYYLRRKGAAPLESRKLVTKFFVQSTDEETAREDSYLDFRPQQFNLGLENVVGTNWEMSAGVHLGGRVVEELISLLNARATVKLEPFPYMVSIIVPGLNEARSVKIVLHNLSLLNFQPLGLAKEILYIDGGSTDGSFELAQSEALVHCYQPSKVRGRGDALRFGARMAKGNIVVFFPSDGEYDPADVIPLVRAIMSNEYRVAFGSRAVKCVDLSERIKSIYRGNYVGYLVSKYGGMMLSVLGLILYNRFIADPLTGMKVFEIRTLRAMELRSSGLDLETEIIAKLSAGGIFIVELPVGYRPRRKVDGKKTTIIDGLLALWRLVWLRMTWRKDKSAMIAKYYEKTFDNYSGF